MSQKILIGMWAIVAIALIFTAIFTPKDNEIASQILFLSSTILRKSYLSSLFPF
jgi:hypothetical protein